MSNEYTNTRTYTVLDTLENADYLLRTEYGSLITEDMFKDHVFTQINGAIRRITGISDQPRIRVTVELIQENEQAAE